MPKTKTDQLMENWLSPAVFPGPPVQLYTLSDALLRLSHLLAQQAHVTMLALQAMSPGPEKHLTVTCTDGQMDGGGQVEITWCSSLLAQHTPALAAVVCIQAGH